MLTHFTNNSFFSKLIKIHWNAGPMTKSQNYKSKRHRNIFWTTPIGWLMSRVHQGLRPSTAKSQTGERFFPCPDVALIDVTDDYFGPWATFGLGQLERTSAKVLGVHKQNVSDRTRYVHGSMRIFVHLFIFLLNPEFRWTAGSDYVPWSFVTTPTCGPGEALRLP